MDSILSNFASPPQWSLNAGIFGRACVIVAIVAFVLSAISWIAAGWMPKLERIGKVAFTVGGVSLFGAFISLAVLFIGNRLEYAYVYEHGDLGNPLQYRIAGIWSGQQGSFLLWACTSAIFGLLAVRGTGALRRWFTVVYAMFLGSIAGILAYETPFSLNTISGYPIVPHSGVGLAPALQNYWVVIHPPTIFMGFGALTVLAAYAFSAMATNRVSEWIPMVRPWAILAMTLVGVGLCMGGFWAYETLGWGGFWMWDPVENVSFVPWIFAVTFVHGIMVQATRHRWTISNLLLGGLPFLFFVYGTFLTRSGALSDVSVHSFAEMDNFAHLLLLGFTICSALGFVALWIWRLIQFRKEGLQPDAPPSGLHREGFYRVGGLLLAMVGTATLIGMSVPLFTALAGHKPQMVQEAMYHRVLVWMYVPLMLVMAAAPLIPWRSMGAKEFLKRSYGIICLTAVLLGIGLFMISVSPWTRDAKAFDPIAMPFGQSMGAIKWTMVLVALSCAVVVANAWRIGEMIKRSKMSAFAFLAHIGVAVLMAGLVVSRGLERKAQIMVQEGSRSVGLGYVVTYLGRTGDLTDKENKLVFDLKSDTDHWTAVPSLYYATSPDGAQNPIVWPYIMHRPAYDLYFALHPMVKEATDPVRLALGQTIQMEGFNVTYLKMTRKGASGQVGTQFGALLKVWLGNESMEVNPQMKLGANGPQDLPVPVGNDFQMSLKGMNASDGSVQVQLLFSRPVYPVELFYKPMTVLVWIGAALLGLSGLLTAWYRRKPKGPVPERENPEELVRQEPAKVGAGSKTSASACHEFNGRRNKHRTQSKRMPNY